MRRHTVVTGCAGFIGSHLTDRLLAEGCVVPGGESFADPYPCADIAQVHVGRRRSIEPRGLGGSSPAGRTAR